MASKPINPDDDDAGVDCFGHRISNLLPDPPKLSSSPSFESKLEPLDEESSAAASPVDLVKVSDRLDRLTLHKNPFVRMLTRSESSNEVRNVTTTPTQVVVQRSESSVEWHTERGSVRTVGDWKVGEDTGTVRKYHRGKPGVSFDSAVEDRVQRKASTRSITENPFLTNDRAERRRGSGSTSMVEDGGGGGTVKARGRTLTRDITPPVVNVKLQAEIERRRKIMDSPVKTKQQKGEQEEKAKKALEDMWVSWMDVPQPPGSPEDDSKQVISDINPSHASLYIEPAQPTTTKQTPYINLPPPDDRRHSRPRTPDHVKSKSDEGPRRTLTLEVGENMKRHSKSKSSPAAEAYVHAAAIEETRAKLFANSSKRVDLRSVESLQPFRNYVPPATKPSVPSRPKSEIVEQQQAGANCGIPVHHKAAPDSTPPVPPTTKPTVRFDLTPKPLLTSTTPRPSSSPSFNQQLRENRHLLTRQTTENSQRKNLQRAEAAQLASDLMEYYVITDEDLPTPTPKVDAVEHGRRSVKEEVEKYSHDRLWADMQIKKLTSDVERLRYELVKKETHLLVEKEEHRKLKVRLIELEYELIMLRQQEKGERKS